MATYDFTIRAEDENGAFADRTFNIEVQNNLVDRIAITDGTNIYSSVDGKSWTIRYGKGNGFLHYVNGWWVGVNYYTSPFGHYVIERVSKDCINWIDVKNTCVNEHGDLVTVETGGMLGESYIENGYAYFHGSYYSTTHGVRLFGIIKTNDFQNYQMAGYNPDTAIQDNTPNAFMSGGDITTDYSIHMSNIVKKDGKYYMRYHSKDYFYVSNSLESDPWYKTPPNPNMPNNTGLSIPQLMNYNGYLVSIAYDKLIHTYSRKFTYCWTYDMVNFNYNNNVFASHPIMYYSAGILFDYNNGVLSSIDGSSLKIFNSVDLQSFDNTLSFPDNDGLGNTFQSSYIQSATHHKGQIIAVTYDKKVWLINQLTGDLKYLSTLPNEYQPSNSNIAVMK